MEPWEADVRAGATRPRCGHEVGWKETLFFFSQRPESACGQNGRASGKKRLMEQETLTGQRQGSWSWKLVKDTHGSYGSEKAGHWFVQLNLSGLVQCWILNE